MTAPVGRSVELERARAFLEAAGRRFSVLVLEGEAGIGKTIVFEEILRVAAADGALVLRARAAQAEARLALSTMADLLEAVPSTALGELPLPQRRAIDVALMREDPGDEPVGDRALAVAVRSVLVALSRTQPVLVAIDDLHWLDPASEAVLGHILRRLSSEPIGVLATRRLGEDPSPWLDELGGHDVLQRLGIGPMTLGAVHHLIRAQLGESLARPMLLRIHQASGGNPLFALEVARTLLEAGPLLPGQPLPIPPDVETVVRTRLSRLPARVRDVLLVAAALAQPRVDLVAAAVGRAVDDDLATAEERGVATGDGDVIRFRHPLFSSALYGSVGPEQRRGLHGRLATLVHDVEERARHLALASRGRDEGTAQAVHAAAGDASRRGAPTAAVELLEHALVLGDPTPDVRAERVFDLAESLARTGDNARALDHLTDVDAFTGWPSLIHGPALDLMLELTYWINGPGVELDRLGQHLLAGELPPDVRAQVHTALARLTEDDLPRALAYADAALEELDALGADANPFVRATALAFRVRNRLVLGNGLDRPGLREALELEATHTRGARDRALGADGFGQWLRYADEVGETRTLLEAGIARDLEAGYEKGAMNKLQHLALTECLAGNLGRAREHALHACELHDLERNRILGFAYPILAIVEAHRGEADVVYAVRDMYREQGIPAHLSAALGLLELSRGDYRAAFDYLAAGLEGQAAAGLREPGIHRLHANAAEAAVALGELDRAGEITDELEAHGDRVDHRWSRAAGARSRALLLAAHGDLSAAVATAAEALRWHDGLAMPFERARTLLVKGTIERRARRRSEAHRSLSEAAQAFETMGARVWAERARAELDRVGLRRSSGDELTEGERRCAELAATGMTNREVAAALFVSPKTVEANLARAYRKLGITSRAELGARMGESLQT